MIRTEFSILLVLSACAVISMDFLCIASESQVGTVKIISILSRFGDDEV